jgi:hypothetical protein
MLDVAPGKPSTMEVNFCQVQMLDEIIKQKHIINIPPTSVSIIRRSNQVESHQQRSNQKN